MQNINKNGIYSYQNLFSNVNEIKNLNNSNEFNPILKDNLINFVSKFKETVFQKIILSLKIKNNFPSTEFLNLKEKIENLKNEIIEKKEELEKDFDLEIEELKKELNNCQIILSKNKSLKENLQFLGKKNNKNFSKFLKEIKEELKQIQIESKDDEKNKVIIRAKTLIEQDFSIKTFNVNNNKITLNNNLKTFKEQLLNIKKLLTEFLNKKETYLTERNTFSINSNSLINI